MTKANKQFAQCVKEVADFCKDFEEFRRKERLKRIKELHKKHKVIVLIFAPKWFYLPDGFWVDYRWN